MSALCNSIDTDWKHKKQRTTTTRTTKKLHSNISKWSFFSRILCLFFAKPENSLLQSIWNTKQNAYFVDVLIENPVETTATAKEMRNEIGVRWTLRLAHKMIEFHKVDDFWAICCWPNASVHRKSQHYNNGQLFSVPILSDLRTAHTL